MPNDRAPMAIDFARLLARTAALLDAAPSQLIHPPQGRVVQHGRWAFEHFS
jgi:hypothetical protein